MPANALSFWFTGFRCFVSMLTPTAENKGRKWPAIACFSGVQSPTRSPKWVQIATARRKKAPASLRQRGPPDAARSAEDSGHCRHHQTAKSHNKPKGRCHKIAFFHVLEYAHSMDFPLCAQMQSASSQLISTATTRQPSRLPSRIASQI